MKKKFLSLLILFGFISSTGYSQLLADKIKSEDVVAGVIIKEGKEIPGYIRAMGYVYEPDKKKLYPSPWLFQSDIKFIAKDVFETTEKIKNKMYETYSAKDIDGYKYENSYYESVKYADMSAVGMAMVAKKIFMYKEKEAKISLYKHYQTPPPIVGSEGFAPYFEECAKPTFVYKMGKDGKLKAVNDMNVEKELADCPLVVEKQKNGEYKVVGSEEKTSGLKKLVNNTVFKEQVRLMAIEDYNNNLCSK